jgi:diguanylate cyclase (GGDEF)-like protein/PAS domain S-box-containing protein
MVKSHRRISGVLCLAKNIAAGVALSLALLALLLLPESARSQTTPPSAHTLHSISEIFARTPKEAQAGIPVELDTVVLYSDREWNLLFLYDPTGDLFLDIHDSPASYPQGTRIHVSAVTAGDDNYVHVVQPHIRITGRGPLPTPEPRTIAELNAGYGDGHYVTIEGTLQSCNENWDRICFRILDGPATAWVVFPSPKDASTNGLIGAKVRLKGVAGTHQDENGKRIAAQIFMSNLRDIQILVPGPNPIGASKALQTLLTIKDVQKLSNAEAAKSRPVELQAIVLFSDPGWGVLFVKDATANIFLFTPRTGPSLSPGTRVRIDAVTASGQQRPILTNPNIQILGQESPPAPIVVSLSEAAAGKGEGEIISTEGVLRPCDSDLGRICFRIADGKTQAWVVSPHPFNPYVLKLLGAVVRLKGLSGLHTDEKGKLNGTQIYVNKPEDIVGEDTSVGATFDSPPTPIADLRPPVASQRFVRPVHIRGTVTWSSPNQWMIQDSSGSVSVTSFDSFSFPTDKRVDVVGFPSHGDLTPLQLVNSDIRLAASQLNAQLSPLDVTAAQIAERHLNGNRVRLRAHLVGQNTTPNEFIFFCTDGRHKFSIRIPRNDATSAIVGLPNGASLKITGVVVVRKGTPQWPESFQILVASPSDMVLDETGWFTFLHVFLVLSGMGAVVAAVLVWVGLLRRTVAKQTAFIRATLESELQLATQYQRLFERNLAAVFRWNPDGALLDFNPAFVKLLGFQSPEELALRNYWDFEAYSDEREILREALRLGAQENREATLRRDDGSFVHLLMNITPVDTPKGKLYETTAIDISQLRHHQIELQKAKDTAVFDSLNDPLTGLPNRRLVSERLHSLLTLNSGKRSLIALLFIDLDGFKVVNDSFGHAIGDELLKEVALRLRSQVRKSDLVARLGGDEFMVILEEIRAKEETAMVAGSLLDILARPFYIENFDISIGASIGISVYPESALDGEELIKQADSAMYVAKREGRNRIMYFTPEIGAEVQERTALENQLRGAITRNEISIEFQPEFALTSNRLLRFEALARWVHPTLGVISPGKFIPIAEESGLIVALGAFIMEQACTEAVLWQSVLPTPVQVAVNVSSIQFRRKGYADEVRTLLHQVGLDPSLLQIELTESVMMGDTQNTIETMNQLRSMGISLAIDDFGTGYSSMSYLRSLLFSTMKIDSSFVHGLGHQPESESMMKTLIVLAHSFGMKVIVEGVETAAQLQIVRTLGANEVQGFYTGRPTPNPREALKLAAASSTFPDSSLVSSIAPAPTPEPLPVTALDSK